MTDIFCVNTFLVSVSISVSVSCSRVSTTSPEYSGISAYTVSGKDVAADVDVCGFRRYKAYVNIRRGSLVRWCQITVRSSKMRVFRSLYLPYEVPTGFTDQNLHGFARFSGDSMALCIIYNLCCAILRYCCKSHRCGLWSVAYLGFQKGGQSLPSSPSPPLSSLSFPLPFLLSLPLFSLPLPSLLVPPSLPSP